MSMTKEIEIDGKMVKFKASAAIPRIYYMKYGRDIFADLDRANKEMNANNPESSAISMYTLGAFEDIAYLMAKHADPSIPDTVEEWLEDFNVFSIYMVLKEIIDLWNLSELTQVVAKKNGMPSTGK